MVYTPTPVRARFQAVCCRWKWIDYLSDLADQPHRIWPQPEDL